MNMPIRYLQIVRPHHISSSTTKRKRASKKTHLSENTKSNLFRFTGSWQGRTPPEMTFARQEESCTIDSSSVESRCLTTLLSRLMSGAEPVCDGGHDQLRVRRLVHGSGHGRAPGCTATQRILHEHHRPQRRHLERNKGGKQ
ncbi:hypothetical protein NPIL_608911 [Nephila pilipes]|uniref:Uncharacterized protein n=1 Tax=Nephila pilipes TaxID=299642 RepID=A0A8X6IZI7_NEPPI|nr:hypothetical protein NPIL_608911 [Nephila pilipes]